MYIQLVFTCKVGIEDLVRGRHCMDILLVGGYLVRLIFCVGGYLVRKLIAHLLKG